MSTTRTAGAGVVLVNPNTSSATTAMMAGRFRAALDACGCDRQVTALTVAEGPAMITGPEALAAAAGHVVDLVRGLPRGHGDAPVAVVVAAFGDPGVPELRGEGWPVTGIGGAAVRAAARGGRRFAVATTTPDLVPAIRDLVDREGLSDLCTGVDLTPTDPLVLAGDPVACREELDAVVRRCLAAGARRVVIGGGPLSDAAADLAGRYPGVIVEPLTAAAGEVAAEVANSRHS